MPGYVIGNFFAYSIINAFTPGPGNILALNTVTDYGWKKGKPLFLGIFTGYYVVQILCAVFVFGVSTFLPAVLSNTLEDLPTQILNPFFTVYQIVFFLILC